MIHLHPQVGHGFECDDADLMQVQFYLILQAAESFDQSQSHAVGAWDDKINCLWFLVRIHPTNSQFNIVHILCCRKTPLHMNDMQSSLLKFK